MRLANPAVSVIQTTWRRKDPGELDAFKTWYYELLAQRVLVHASSPETARGVPPGAPAVPPMASVDSVDKLADLLDARFRNNLDGQALASETNKYNQYEIIVLEYLGTRAPDVTYPWRPSRTSGPRSKEWAGKTLICKPLWKGTWPTVPRTAPGSTVSSSPPRC
jgi:hypothetical protein